MTGGISRWDWFDAARGAAVFGADVCMLVDVVLSCTVFSSCCGSFVIAEWFSDCASSVLSTSSGTESLLSRRPSF